MITYKYKLYSHKRNRFLHQQIDIAGLVYNHCIALCKRYYKMSGKSISFTKLQSHIAKRRKRLAYSHYQLINSQTVQEIVQRIEKGYKLFFSERKQGNKKVGLPTFKKVKKYKSFTLKQSGWSLTNNQLMVKFGNKEKKYYKFFHSRPIQGKIKTVTVKRSTIGELFLCIVTDFVSPHRIGFMTGKTAGFDFGLKQYLTGTHSSLDVKSPLFFKQGSKTIAKLNKSLSSKKKGSRNRSKARIALAKAHKRIANQRSDFHWKLAHKLCQEYDVIHLEALNIAGMKKLWGRKISDLSHSLFLEKLTVVAAKTGKAIKYLPRFYPSSKTCSTCGTVKESLTLSEREWKCTSCGTTHDRDRNAAINIENYQFK